MTSLSFELKSEKHTQAVILFHGMTGSPFEMKKYADFLFKNGYDVFCDCLPGHGDNPIKIERVKWNDWTKFSIERYDYLTSKYENVYLAGLCLGAVLCLYISQNRNVDGIIGLSTTLFLDGWTMPWYNFLLPLGLASIFRFYYTFPEREPYGIKNSITRKAVSKLMSANTVALDNYPLTCVYELLKLSKHVRKNIHKVCSPIIILHSIEDDLTSTKSSDFVFNHISSKQKEYFKLNNSYHLILYDNEKQFVYSKTLEFLKQFSKEKVVKC